MSNDFWLGIWVGSLIGAVLLLWAEAIWIRKYRVLYDHLTNATNIQRGQLGAYGGSIDLKKFLTELKATGVRDSGEVRANAMLPRKLAKAPKTKDGK